MIAQFGYEILDVSSMPDILSVSEFNDLTANKYASDTRVESILSAVSAAVRTYCGWHVAPNVQCRLVLNVKDLHVSRKYNDVNVQLPYRFITKVSKVLVNAYLDTNNNWVGDEVEFYCDYSGYLTLYDTYFNSRKSQIVVLADVGLVDTTMIKSIIVSRVSNVLSGTSGVQSESAGGVSISYDNSFMAGAKAHALLTADREMLNTFKLVELL